MQYSEQDLLEELKRVAGEIGHQPSITDFRKYGEISVTTYYNRFGSWNAAIEAAGFAPQNPQEDIPREDLRAHLLKLTEDLGEPPRAAQMNDEGDYWASTYKDEFGSWNAALEAAGLEPRSTGTKISEADLLAGLQKLANELDKSPTYHEMDEKGEYGGRTYVRAFGSWNEALQAAGFETTNTGTEVTEADLLGELRRLSEELEKQPSSRDMDERGEYSTATYQRHFGSWSAALKRAFEDSEEPTDTH